MRNTLHNENPSLTQGTWERHRSTVGTALMVVGVLGGFTGGAYTMWAQSAHEAAYRSSLEYQATRSQLDQQFIELTAGLLEFGYESDAPDALRDVTRDILAETTGVSTEIISDEHRAKAETLINQMAVLREHPKLSEWWRQQLKRHEGRLRVALARIDGSRQPTIIQGRGLWDGLVEFMLCVLIGMGVAATGHALRSKHGGGQGEMT